MTSIFRRKGRKGWTLKFTASPGVDRMRSFRRRQDAEDAASLLRESALNSTRRAMILGAASPFAQVRPDGATFFELSGLQVLALRSPLVYAWLRGPRVLYVGRGLKGMVRPLSHAHHRLDVIQPTDRLRVWPCATDLEAAILEQKLIAELLPELNGATPPWEKKRA